MDEKQYTSVIPYSVSGDLLTDARTIIDSARQYAYSAVNVPLVQRNWLLGKRISEEELKEDRKDNYGMEIIKLRLSKFLGIRCNAMDNSKTIVARGAAFVIKPDARKYSSQ